MMPSVFPAYSGHASDWSTPSASLNSTQIGGSTFVKSVVSESTYWSVCCTTAARLSPTDVVSALSGLMTYVPVLVTTCTSLLCSRCRSYMVPACTCVAAAPRDASFPGPGFRGNDAASATPFGFFAHERDGTARWFVAPDEPSRDLWVDAERGTQSHAWGLEMSLQAAALRGEQEPGTDDTWREEAEERKLPTMSLGCGLHSSHIVVDRDQEDAGRARGQALRYGQRRGARLGLGLA